MRIFITGGTGFIGRHVVQKLADLARYDIYVLTRRKNVNISKVTYVQGDISDVSLLRELVDRVDYVIHMAGTKSDPDSYLKTNVAGTKDIIEACKKTNDLLKFIYLSSVGVIGKTSNLMINEQTECNPNNEYERSKYEGELIVREYSNQNPKKVVILRPTNVFGENDPEMRLLNLFKKVMHNHFYFVGKSAHNYYTNYLYVKEISELIYRLLELETTNDLYIVNTPINLSEFISTIKEIFHSRETTKYLPYWAVKGVAVIFDLFPTPAMKHPPINSKKLQELTSRIQYSSSLLIKDLNWRPAFEMKKALQNLALYYKEQGLLI